MAEETTEWGGPLWAAADLLTPMAIRVAATLRLADHIAAGTRTTEALAATVNADVDALDRLLRHLMTADVLSRDENSGAYELTALGERLRDDHPDGIRPWLDITGAIGHADLSFVHLLHTVRTGEPSYPRQYGSPFWDDLSANPALAASFDQLMGARLTDAPAVAEAYPWGDLGHLIDVGGGDATLLIAILRAHRELRGTVLDLPGPASRAEKAIGTAELVRRADVVPGSFFDALPAGAGGYLLSGVIHDWDDEDAVRILRRCAEAAAPNGKVILIEDSIEAVQGATGHTSGDLRMLCYVRGRDRTLAQLTELSSAVGLQVDAVTPTGSRSILELHTAH